MKKIYLGSDSKKFALVDDEDYPVVSRYKWHASICGGAQRRPYKSKRKECIFIHRFILGVDNEIKVKHKNGNRLDCRKSNLIVIGGH